MMRATIIKGSHAGKKVVITRTEKEYMGTGKTYQLKDDQGRKIWNGQFSNFPQSFIKIHK